MPEKSIQELLAESFPKATKENWEHAASIELNGKDALDELQWKAADGLSFLAYYDREDVNQLEYLQKYHFQPATSFLGTHAWLNLPKVTVSDEISTNQIALDHLVNGADGILFDLGKSTSIDFEKLLYKLEWPHCAISFQPSSIESFLDISNYISTKQYDAASITGNCFWNDGAKNGKEIMERFSKYKNYRSLGLIIEPSSPVEEILEALQKGVKLIDELSEAKIDITTIFSGITFSLPVGENFFLEIAKFNVLRMLWFQIAQAYSLKNYQPYDLQIHARSEFREDEKYQPHGNLLKSTLAGMAAILGGCHSLTVLAEDEGNSMMNRIARNVSNILREESHLNLVADPLKGSYVLENMIHVMAKRVWDKFTNP